MGMNVLMTPCLLCFTLICHFTNGENNPRHTLILEKMKNDNALCLFPSKELQNLELLTICDRPSISNDKPIEKYLTHDFVPLLCMALYDVSLRLCELSNTHPKLKTSVPQTVDTFKALMNYLENKLENKFNSHIEQFCSSTVIPNVNLLYRINDSNETARWNNYFNQCLKDKDKCKQVCKENGLNGPDKVNPFCSFIVWSNALITKTINYESKNYEGDTTGKENVNKQPGLELKYREDPVDSNNPLEDKNKVKAGNESLVTQSKPSNLEQVAEGDLPLINDPNAVESNDGKQPDTADKKSKDDSGNKFKKIEQVETENIDAANNSLVTTKLESKSAGKIQGENSPQSPDNSAKQETHAGEIEKKVEIPETDQSELISEDNGQYSHPMTVSTADPGKDVLQIAEPKVIEQKDNIAPAEKSHILEPAKDTVPEEEQDFVPREDLAKSNEEGIQSVQESPAYQDDDVLNPDKENEPLKLQTAQQLHDKDEFIVRDDHFIEAEDSRFFTNFVTLAVLCIIVYLVFHNKKKLLALAVEGKKRGPSRRRPNTASYSKLDCNLEEAMVSNTTASVTHVLY